MRGWVRKGMDAPEIGVIVVYFLSLAGNVTGNKR
jgi:hypothetical protein